MRMRNKGEETVGLGKRGSHVNVMGLMLCWLAAAKAILSLLFLWLEKNASLPQQLPVTTTSPHSLSVGRRITQYQC